MRQERDGDGRYQSKYTTDEVVTAFETATLPVLTAPEVAEHVGCSRITARNKLEELVEAGRLQRKRVGSRAVVYVRLAAEGGRLSGYGRWKRALWDE